MQNCSFCFNQTSFILIPWNNIKQLLIIFINSIRSSKITLNGVLSIQFRAEKLDSAREGRKSTCKSYRDVIPFHNWVVTLDIHD